MLVMNVQPFFLRWVLKHRLFGTSQTLEHVSSQENVGKRPGWGLKGTLVVFKRHRFFSGVHQSPIIGFSVFEQGGGQQALHLSFHLLIFL